MKIVLEQKKKAVDIAIAGGNPVEYLRECGSDAPDKLWYYIKNKLKDANPELYKKIPDRRETVGKASAVEEELKKKEGFVEMPRRCNECRHYDVWMSEEPCKSCFTENVLERKNYEAKKPTEEKEVIEMTQSAENIVASVPSKPVEVEDELQITGVKTKIGQFDLKDDLVKWDGLLSELTVAEWKELLEIMPKVLKMFGVL